MLVLKEIVTLRLAAFSDTRYYLHNAVKQEEKKALLGVTESLSVKDEFVQCRQ